MSMLWHGGTKRRSTFISGLFVWLAATLLWIAAPAFAAVETAEGATTAKRLAIVIGNSRYESSRLERLPNATNDAAKLSQSLKRLNFEVLTATDVTADAFAKLLAEAGQESSGAGAVLIFYAGHGVQIRGENYLLPVDTPDPESVEALTSRAVKLNDVIARFARRDRQTFVFLDACRNNPVPAGEGISDGLAQVEVGENTFVAFATQPGNVTVDGAGENSPFTTALIKNLEIPGLSISDMMIRVRNDTESLTVGRQVPWDQSNLREQFYFTEQQVIDPAQLSASLSQILADPAAKERLQAELVSNDLQTAVLVVGQTLRSVAPQMNSTSVAVKGTQVVSLEPNVDFHAAQERAISDLGTLIVGVPSSSDKLGEDAQAKLAMSVQTELRRLGCYRMKVDGDWGKGSARALTDYYRNTKQEAAGTEPSVELLSELFLRSGRICKAPVAVKPAKVASQGSRPSEAKAVGSTGKKARGSGKRSGSAASRPASPPPDISGGIGIGGVF